MNNKLGKIQQELRCPKTQFNSFGNYNYRSCEGILEAVKPLLEKYDCTLTLRDTLKECGGWVFVEATATLYDGETTTTVQAAARHEDHKKGMDASQVTGACSSYARKYALNGLFLIDDNRDSDATNDHGKSDVPPADAAPPRATRDDARRINDAAVKAGLAPGRVVAMLRDEPFCCARVSQLLRVHVDTLIDRIAHAAGQTPAARKDGGR